MSRHGIQLKTPAQIAMMRRAGLVVAKGLAEMGAAAVAGATLAEIDAVGRDVLAVHGATSNFLGYGAEWGYPPYPGVACISVNEVVVHGIPDQRRLVAGDIVSIDFGAVVDGWHGDAARTFMVGEVDDESRRLSEVTRNALWDGIAAVASAKRVGDISHAIQRSVETSGLQVGIVREYTGHGIGTEMHQEPDVPNSGRPHRGARIVPGVCLAIEPILTLGSPENVELDDEWTVVTCDGSRAAHWENSVAVLADGIFVLTEPDGGAAELAARGVRIASLD
ncbi:methionine aminopeptidase, type I [Propionibacterium sp. oral taxon 192 str. F0372]|uniref:type I methionyl aminopeptidase n=1 Tax=Propionibacterium sp. oral taxon 192 TaxID=671222 RepID=UPI000353877D|nr:type I methionyl aminopeptidase [Propionibacterium sp. oral taxon 192]EPH07104.1 methionine aminopeptidase, type I [Propionibacterium sp. oral taxon 192 str. F0372]